MRGRPRKAVPVAVTFGVLLALCGLALQANAEAGTTPVVHVVAGTGTDGPLVNDIPATQAQLWGISDVAAAADGTFLIADTHHHQIRRVGTDGVIRAFYGSGNQGCNIAGSVLWQPRGVALDTQGGVYIANTLCGQIIHVDRGGAARVVAGQNVSYNPNITPGMPATQASLSQPAGMAYDGPTDSLYIADQYSSRVLKVTGGSIWVVAGTGTNGYNGDEIAATSARLNYPSGVVLKDGDLYIADGSNARVRKVDPAGVIHTVAGNGNLGDTGDGGPATSASLDGVGGIAFASTGALAIASSRSGSIRQVDATGIIRPIVNLGTCAAGISIPANGDVYATSACAQRVYRVVTPAPPVPKPRVASIVPDPPSTTDTILTRGVTITPASDGATIDHYEYGWARNAQARAPAGAVQRAGTSHGRLDYSETNPDQDWYLMARGVNGSGGIGEWTTPLKVRTPKAPKLIILGDSVSSGHHNDYGDNGQTRCDDEAYGYAFEFSLKWRAALPAQWRSPGDYTNLAHSGFATQTRKGTKIDGSVLAGGENACHPREPLIVMAPLAEARAMLSSAANSWNRVVTTAGANDTNWVPVINELLKRAFMWQQQTGKPFPVSGCKLIDRRWDGRYTKVQESVSGGVRKIVLGLREADPAVRITWLGYYNIAGTGTNKTTLSAYLPKVCDSAVGSALAVLHDTIRAGLQPDVPLVDVDAVMHGQDTFMQPLFLIKGATDEENPPGWPHPDSDGSKAIAELLRP